MHLQIQERSQREYHFNPQDIDGYLNTKSNGLIGEKIGKARRNVKVLKAFEFAKSTSTSTLTIVVHGITGLTASFLEFCLFADALREYLPKTTVYIIYIVYIRILNKRRWNNFLQTSDWQYCITDGKFIFITVLMEEIVKTIRTRPLLKMIRSYHHQLDFRDSDIRAVIASILGEMHIAFFGRVANEGVESGHNGVKSV